MSTLQCRGSIALASVVVALLWSRPADAQIGTHRAEPREPGNLVNRLVTGVQYDVMNQSKAESRLEHVQAKLRRDAEHGNAAAADRDGRRIHILRNRIKVDEWLIRQNSLCDPGYYPNPLRLDPMTCEALASVRRPPDAPYPPQALYPSRP